MLTLDNVSTGYDATNVLHGVSITASPESSPWFSGERVRQDDALQDHQRTDAGTCGSIDYEGASFIERVLMPSSRPASPTARRSPSVRKDVGGEEPASGVVPSPEQFANRRDLR